MCDPCDLSFIRVKGQIGTQLSVERLNPVTKATLRAIRMTWVTSMNTDSILYNALTFMAGEENMLVFVICLLINCQLIINI